MKSLTWWFGCLLLSKFLIVLSKEKDGLRYVRVLLWEVKHSHGIEKPRVCHKEVCKADILTVSE